MPLEDYSSRKFLEIKDYRMKQPVLSPEERTVVQHFKPSHSIGSHGRFIVPLQQKSGVKALRESRTKERLNRLERSLRNKKTFQELIEIYCECLQTKVSRRNYVEKTLCDATGKPIITSKVCAIQKTADASNISTTDSSSNTKSYDSGDSPILRWQGLLFHCLSIHPIHHWLQNQEFYSSQNLRQRNCMLMAQVIPAILKFRRLLYLRRRK